MFRFPWTNEHELNLDWIIRTVKSLVRRVKHLEESGGDAVTSVNGATGDVIIPVASPATINPSPLAQYPAIGIDDGYARGDHAHPLPSAADVGAAPEVVEITVIASGDVTQALSPGTLYHFTGALTNLTITLTAPGAGIIAHYHFDFDSGSTAPTVILPVTVTMPGGSFAPEASKHYEVDILNEYGVFATW